MFVKHLTVWDVNITLECLGLKEKNHKWMIWITSLPTLEQATKNWNCSVMGKTACPRGKIERGFRTDHLSYNFISTLIIVKSDLSVDRSLQFQSAEKISPFVFVWTRLKTFDYCLNPDKTTLLNNSSLHGEIKDISYCCHQDYHTDDRDEQKVSLYCCSELWYHWYQRLYFGVICWIMTKRWSIRESEVIFFKLYL